MASDMEVQIVKRVFSLPKWYIPSITETVRLFDYVLNRDSESDARIARFLDCSAFCNEDDCFFCGHVKPVFPECCFSKVAICRGY